MLRSKPFLTYFLICAVPLLLLAALNYWNATRSVDKTINAIVENDLHSFTASVNGLLEEQGQAVLKMAASGAASNGGYFKNVAIYNRNHQPLSSTTGTPPIPDDRVWSTQGKVLLEQLIDDGSKNAGLQFAAPIQNATGLENDGAVVAIVDLPLLFSAAARPLETRLSRNSSAPRIVVRDRAGNVVYQGDSPAEQASGATASAPMPRLNVTITAARDTSEFMSAARRWAIAGFLLALLLALLAAFLLDRHVRNRARGIARVTEDLSAIAHGELDRRIVLQSSDDARAIADNINMVTAQLRAQIAREEESRQFESFVRLSAMLTHDLKNAIEGLSLTVNNMERHFDNEQFRIDALKGLTNATDKLKAIVARLNRPVSSLSGEHKLPTKTDLVPILNRVIAMTAEPMRGRHTIQTRLPASLFALVDGARVEEVVENLIINALEAMNDKSGTLTIEAGPDANGAPTFSVSDTGPGMNRSFVENRLFRPFSTTKKNGIGLGLYTCREVIRASGGSIDVQSVEGAGTTFRVVLPSIPHDRRN
jgi:signal transduction histidine kinase